METAALERQLPGAKVSMRPHVHGFIKTARMDTRAVEIRGALGVGSVRSMRVAQTMFDECTR